MQVRDGGIWAEMKNLSVSGFVWRWVCLMWVWHTGYGRNVGNSVIRSAESSTVAEASASAMLLGALLSFFCRISIWWHILAKKEYDVGGSLRCLMSILFWLWFGIGWWLWASSWLLRQLGCLFGCDNKFVGFGFCSCFFFYLLRQVLPAGCFCFGLMAFIVGLMAFCGFCRCFGFWCLVDDKTSDLTSDFCFGFWFCFILGILAVIRIWARFLRWWVRMNQGCLESRQIGNRL